MPRTFREDGDAPLLRDERVEPPAEGEWRGPRLMMRLRGDFFLCLTTERRGESFCAHLDAPIWRRRPLRYGTIAVGPEECEWIAATVAAARQAAVASDREPLIDSRWTSGR